MAIGGGDGSDGGDGDNDDCTGMKGGRGSRGPEPAPQPGKDQDVFTSHAKYLGKTVLPKGITTVAQPRQRISKKSRPRV